MPDIKFSGEIDHDRFTIVKFGGGLYDGDTFTKGRKPYVNDNLFDASVRCYGYNSPEMRNSKFKTVKHVAESYNINEAKWDNMRALRTMEAREMLALAESIIGDKELYLLILPLQKDAYGRIIGVVYTADGKCLSEEMLRNPLNVPLDPKYKDAHNSYMSMTTYDKIVYEAKRGKR
jgi:endonuclease YncB( thermonuclease family)